MAVQDDPDASVVGGSLYALGLIPDFELLSSDGDPTQRLGLRNLPVVARLREHAGTPVERVVGLPLSETPEGVDFTKRLIDLDGDRAALRRPTLGRARRDGCRPGEISRWSTGLSLIELPPPGAIRIDILPLPLPRRDDGIMVLESTGSVRVSWQTNPAPLDVAGLEYFRVELVSSDGVVAWETPADQARDRTDGAPEPHRFGPLGRRAGCLLLPSCRSQYRGRRARRPGASRPGPSRRESAPTRATTSCSSAMSARTKVASRRRRARPSRATQRRNSGHGGRRSRRSSPKPSASG